MSSIPLYYSTLLDHFPTYTSFSSKHKLFSLRDKNLTFTQWEYVDRQSTRNPSKIYKVLEKVTRTTSGTDWMNLLRKQWDKMVTHVRIKRTQSKSYLKYIDSTKPDSDVYDPKVMVVQIDWSQNYTTLSQDEIQSANWAQSQISLFTASTWCQGKQVNKVYAMDGDDHGKCAVAGCLRKLLNDAGIPDEVDTIHIWSDGPYSQFKNKFIVKLAEMLGESLMRNIVWHYSATSHGKVSVLF